MEQVKILAISDFHGKMPKILQEDKDFDVVMTAGDFCDSEKIRKEIFKHWQERQKWFEIVGEKKAQKIGMDAIKSGEKTVKRLSLLAGKRQIYGIPGNLDFRPRKSSRWKIHKKDFYTKYTYKIKNYKDINLKRMKFLDFELIGYGEQSFPEKMISNRLFKKKYSKMDKLFSSAKKKAKQTILLCHNPPHGYLDKVRMKESPEYGNHLGSQVVAAIIQKYHPFLVICGHMHENQGIAMMARTTIVNCGEAGKGNYAVIMLKNAKCSVKLRRGRKK